MRHLLIISLIVIVVLVNGKPFDPCPHAYLFITDTLSITVTTGHRRSPVGLMDRISPLLSTYEGHLNHYKPYKHHHHHHGGHRQPHYGRRYQALEYEIYRIRELELELRALERTGMADMEPGYYYEVERRLLRHEYRLAEILELN